MLRVVSLGAGVQSTAMVLMAAKGEIGPMPVAAIFADTQAEPDAVYAHLRWLMTDSLLPFPVHIVSAGNLTEQVASERPKGKWLKVDIPVFWAAFPRKAAKLDTIRAYEKARRLDSAENILAGVERYKRTKPEYADWCHPATVRPPSRLQYKKTLQP